MRRMIASQLNVNTVIGALSLAVLMFLGKTIMEDHDSTTKHTTQLDSMGDDVRTIKATLQDKADKSDVESSERAIWQAIRQGGSAQTPKGLQQQSN